jgi:hypothetical protein
MGTSQKFLSMQHESRLMSPLSKDETGLGGPASEAAHVLMLMMHVVFVCSHYRMAGATRWSSYCAGWVAAVQQQYSSSRWCDENTG